MKMTNYKSCKLVRYIVLYKREILLGNKDAELGTSAVGDGFRGEN